MDWCCMYKLNGESMDHLLLHCIIAKDLWDLSLCLFGVTWLMPNSIIAMLASWKGKLGNHRSGKLWTTALSCLMCCLWKEWNLCTFEGKKLPLPPLKFLFLKMLYCYTTGLSIPIISPWLLHGLFRWLIFGSFKFFSLCFLCCSCVCTLCTRIVPPCFAS